MQSVFWLLFDFFCFETFHMPSGPTKKTVDRQLKAVALKNSVKEKVKPATKLAEWCRDKNNNSKAATILQIIEMTKSRLLMLSKLVTSPLMPTLLR